MESFDLVVIGSGPGGQKCAVQAAKLGKKVAIVERHHEVVGVCINTGTIPSKTIREAVLDLSGNRQRRLYGEDFAPRRRPTVIVPPCCWPPRAARLVPAASATWFTSGTS